MSTKIFSTRNHPGEVQSITNEMKSYIAADQFKQVIESVALEFVNQLPAKTRSKLNGRLERGLALAQNGNVFPVNNLVQKRVFRVLSSKGNRFYHVNLEEKSCDCPDCQKGNVCKHRIASYYLEQAMKQTRIIHPEIHSTKRRMANQDILDSLGFTTDSEQKSKLVRESLTINDCSNPIQISLIQMDPITAEKNTRIRHKSLDKTLRKIRQLRDELNAQLYENPDDRPTIFSPTEAAKFLDGFIGYLDHEEFWVINMDSRHRIMSVIGLYKGSVNSSQIRIAEVFRQAILDNCPAIIVAHNHPSGNLQPSPEDIASTKAMHQAGNLLDIDLLDHLIISHGDFVSLKQKGLVG